MPTQQHQPFWFDQALQLEQTPSARPLDKRLKADVCIVGGGYTGLWTAIKLKQQSPELHICLIEAGLCGQGASGRNGGAMLTWSSKFSSLQKLYGNAEAIRLVQASEQAVWDIRDFCAAHSIDAEVRVDGAYYTATNSAQQAVMPAVMQQLANQGLNHWQSLSTSQLRSATGSARHLSGYYTPNAGSLHPGKLVRGLAQVARQMGVQIFEQSPMRKLLPGKIHYVFTPQGEIKCNQVVLATNSWLAQQCRALRRSIILVSSDMVISRPIPERLAELGLEHGAAVIDSRTFVHYYRTSLDGRLMLGKGGNTFAFANRMHSAFNQPSAYQQQLTEALREFFPGPALPLERSWNGASDRSVNGLPFFGELPQTPRVYYGIGYSGNGVVQSFLGGEMLASLVLENDDVWCQSGMVNPAKIAKFPPEPFRYLGAQLVKQAIRNKERAEDREQTPSLWDRQMARFAGNAGKADPQTIKPRLNSQ